MKERNDFWKSRLTDWTTLDAPSRISEGLFGLIMVLTFTCTISVSTSGRQEVGQLLWAALGCNLAWGLVDGIMYLMDELVNRAHSVKLYNQIKQLNDKKEARGFLRENVAPLLGELLDDEDIDKLIRKIKELPELTPKKVIVLKNFLIAGQIFLIVFLITLPVALPFLFVKDVSLALRVSNGIAIVLLFAGGFSLARYSGLRPVRTALTYTAVGVLLVLMTMALGG